MGLKLGKLYSQSAAWPAVCCYYVSDDERRHTRRVLVSRCCLPLLLVSSKYRPASFFFIQLVSAHSLLGAVGGVPSIISCYVSQLSKTSSLSL